MDWVKFRTNSDVSKLLTRLNLKFKTFTPKAWLAKENKNLDKLSYEYKLQIVKPLMALLLLIQT